MKIQRYEWISFKEDTQIMYLGEVHDSIIKVTEDDEAVALAKIPAPVAREIILSLPERNK